MKFMDNQLIRSSGRNMIQTLGYMGNQVGAFPSAIESLTTEKATKLLRATSYMIVYSIAPLVVLNYVNTQLQAYASGDEETDHTLLHNLTLAPLLYLIDTAVMLYTWRQGIELALETLVIDTMAPSAFTRVDLSSPCTKECWHGFSSNFKGEAALALSYEIKMGIALAASKISYFGPSVAQIIEAYSVGGFISNSALSLRCPNHRSSIPPQIGLSFGLSNLLINQLMNKAFENYIGLPPFLVRRTLQHLILLWLVNIAAQMKIPYEATLKEASIVYSPLQLMDGVCNGTSMLAVEILKVVLPKILKSNPEQNNLFQFLSLASIFQKITAILKEDTKAKSVSTRKDPAFFKKVFPEILQSSQKAIHNRVVRIFWADFRELLLDIIYIIIKAGIPIAKITDTSFKTLDDKIKGSLIKSAHYVWGIDVKLGKILIDLCHEDDFWNFVRALKAWLDVHHTNEITALTAASPQQLKQLRKEHVQLKPCKSLSMPAFQVLSPGPGVQVLPAHCMPRTPLPPLDLPSYKSARYAGMP